MEKNLLIAVVLSITVIILWSIIFRPPSPQEGLQPQKPLPSQEEAVEVAKPPPPLAPVTPLPGKKVSVETALYRVVLTPQGGGIESFRLKKYKEKKEDLGALAKRLASGKDPFRRQEAAFLLNHWKEREEEIARLKEEGGLSSEELRVAQGVELISFGEYYYQTFPPHLVLIGPQGEDLLKGAVYTLQGRDLRLAEGESGKIRFTTRTDNGLEISKVYTFRGGSYDIGLEITVKNRGEAILPLGEMVLEKGPGIGIERKGPRAYGYFGPFTYADDQLIKYKRLRGKGELKRIHYGDIRWVAHGNQYFVGILLPLSKVQAAIMSKNEYNQYTVGLKVDAGTSLRPGGEKEFRFRFFLGPKITSALKAIDPTLERVVDLGIFGSLFKIIYILNFLYRLTHNYGAAIVLLTILINLFLFPLTQKSFRSMKAVQALQPKIMAIREKYKTDLQKQNKEIMELYRKEGVNPMGGCLPMVLQMPIFFALFTTLRNAIELRGASFLWIKDLSFPDTVLNIHQVPLNILPLLMGLATFVQQKLSSPDPQHSRMLFFMPLFLTFIFYNFPAGLVLYWFTNNVLNILTQLFINKGMGKASVSPSVSG